MIVVLGEGTAGDAALSLARGLRRLGASVALGALDPGTPHGDDLVTWPCTMASGDEVAEVLARAEGAGEPVHAVVLVSAGAATTEHAVLATLDPARWDALVETPLRRTLACFQGSYRRLRERGGRLVVVVPTLALVGAAGFVPWAAVAEAQRSLAKSAGRAWGRKGITVNCVAVSPALLRSAPSPEHRGPGATGAGPALDRPGLPPPSLDRLPDMETDVAGVVAALVTGQWTAVTGATIAVDGGVWMTP